MSVSISEAMDGARYVEFYDKCGRMCAIWHGGHTVNFYHVRRADQFEPVSSISVGNFGTGETTLQDVKEGITAHIEGDS